MLIPSCTTYQYIFKGHLLLIACNIDLGLRSIHAWVLCAMAVSY